MAEEKSIPKGHGFNSIAGYRAGKLVVIRCVGSSGGHSLWECQCDCGNVKTIHRRNILGGRVKSCGCLLRRHIAAGLPPRTKAEAMREWRRRNPEVVRAQSAVSHAKASGKIPPAASLACSHCGNQAAEYHHHNGYSEAHKLDVIPLCVPCHKTADTARRFG